MKTTSNVSTKYNQLDAVNKRLQKMLTVIASLTRQVAAVQISDAENAAAEMAEDSEKEGPVIAKLSITVSWIAGKQEPEIAVKSSYSIRRTVEAAGVADDQDELPFGKEGEK